MKDRNWRKLAGGVIVTSALWLGLTASAWAQASTPAEEITVTVAAEPGVLVRSVTPDSPAAKAGLKRGDIILKVAAQPVNQAAELAALIRAAQAGDKLTLTVQHGDEQQAVTLTVGDRNGAAYIGIVPDGALLPGAAAGPRWQPAPPPPVLDHKFAISQSLGVRVITVLPASPAADAGLVAGDVIVGVDGEALAPALELPALIAQYQPGDQIVLQVQPEASAALTKTVTVTLGENPAKPERAYLGVRLAPQVDFAVEAIEVGPGAQPSQPVPGRRFRFSAPHLRFLPPVMPMPPYEGYGFGPLGGLAWCQPLPGDMLLMQPPLPPLFDSVPGELVAPEVELHSFELVPPGAPAAGSDELLMPPPNWTEEGPEL